MGWTCHRIAATHVIECGAAAIQASQRLICRARTAHHTVVYSLSTHTTVAPHLAWRTLRYARTLIIVVHASRSIPAQQRKEGRTCASTKYTALIAGEPAMLQITTQNRGRRTRYCVRTVRGIRNTLVVHAERFTFGAIHLQRTTRYHSAASTIQSIHAIALACHAGVMSARTEQLIGCRTGAGGTVLAISPAITL